MNSGSLRDGFAASERLRREQEAHAELAWRGLIVPPNETYLFVVDDPDRGGEWTARGHCEAAGGEFLSPSPPLGATLRLALVVAAVMMASLAVLLG